MTVKAFIKNEEKKRSKDVETHLPEPVAAPNPTVVPSGSPVPTPATEVQASIETPGPVNGEVGAHDVYHRRDDGNSQDRASTSAEVGVHILRSLQTLMLTLSKGSRDIQDSVQATTGEADVDEEEDDDDDDVVITTERPEDEMQMQPHRHEDEQPEEGGQGSMQEQINAQQSFNFEQNQNFGNMDFSSMNNFNPMTAMQSGMGMPNFGMGMPNMMGKYSKRNPPFARSRLSGWSGMPGMNMDPSMMFGGGFGGMGGMNDMSMSMMNMGMGMGMGMNGMGNFGGMPGMGNMGGGPGFFPPNDGGGYNQQNFGNHMNQNFHHNRGYGRPYNRGFGRGGRGYSYDRGRGGWQNYAQYNHGQNQSFVNQPYQQQQNLRGNNESLDASAQQGATRGSPSYEPMSAPDGATGDNDQQKPLTEQDTNIERVDATDDTGNLPTSEPGDDKVESVPQPEGEDLSKGKPKCFVTSSAPTPTRALDSVPTHAETACKDATNDRSAPNASEESVSGVAAEERSTEHGPSDAFVNAESSYEQQQQGFSYGARGRGGLRGARGGFRGRIGAYGYVSTPNEPESIPPAAPPINAPTGPKAMRAGLPNSGWYSRPQPAAAAAPALQSTPEKQKPVEPEPRARTRSRTRSVSPAKGRDEKKQRNDLHDESEESYERRKERERRKRKERNERYDDDVHGEESSGKNRSRSKSGEGDRSKRRHRDRDDEHRSSRSHRDRSRSRDRRRHRHRSRSAERDASINGEEYDSSRRKHKSDRRREDEYEESDMAKEGSRRHSRRNEDRERSSKDRSNESSRHADSSRDDRERGRDREKFQSVVVEEPEEEFEFKIKGKSASMKQGLDTSMGPPATFGRERSERRSSLQASTPVTPSTPTLDPYAADRENHRKKREAEQQKRLEGRRQSSQSLGKHSRDDDELEAPTGPKGDSARNGKRVRKDLRRHSLKYEDEVDEGDERETRRWR